MAQGDAGSGRDAGPDEVLGVALRGLVRERAPGRLLEERTVRSLQMAGLLGGRRRVPRAWLAAAAAACVALFASGVAVGQWLGTREATRVLVAQQQSTLGEMSALVERTGEAYVNALARLAESGGVDGAGESQVVQEAALEFLHMAANEVVRMAPDDPVAASILQGLDHAARERTPSSRTGDRRRQVMWF